MHPIATLLIDYEWHLERTLSLLTQDDYIQITLKTVHQPSKWELQGLPFHVALHPEKVVITVPTLIRLYEVIPDHFEEKIRGLPDKWINEKVNCLDQLPVLQAKKELNALAWKLLDKNYFFVTHHNGELKEENGLYRLTFPYNYVHKKGLELLPKGITQLEGDGITLYLGAETCTLESRDPWKIEALVKYK